MTLTWKNWSTQQYREALNHPIAQKGFDLDFNAMKWADVCVMVLPCGRSANTEAGWMKGVGKRVMVYSPKEQEPELMYKIYDFISDSMFRINDEINRIEQKVMIILRIKRTGKIFPVLRVSKPSALYG